MNRSQRDKFLKKMANKYIISQQLPMVDPWKNQSAPKTMPAYTISEFSIFQAIKNIRGIMMFPRSYSVEYPEGNVYQPWGATVTFRYIAEPIKTTSDWLNTSGNQNLINQVESQLNNKFNQYVHSVGTTYDGEDGNGKGVYTVTITQKSNTL